MKIAVYTAIIVAFVALPAAAQTKTKLGAQNFFSEATRLEELLVGVQQAASGPGMVAPKILSVNSSGSKPCESRILTQDPLRKFNAGDELDAHKRVVIDWTRVTEVSLQLRGHPEEKNGVTVFGGNTGYGKAIFLIPSESLAKRFFAAAEFLRAECAAPSSSGF